MDKEFVEQMRVKLEEQKKTILEALAAQNADYKKIVEGGDTTGDVIDVASDVIDGQLLESLGTQDANRLQHAGKNDKNMENRVIIPFSLTGFIQVCSNCIADSAGQKPCKAVPRHCSDCRLQGYYNEPAHHNIADHRQSAVFFHIQSGKKCSK